MKGKEQDLLLNKGKLDLLGGLFQFFYPRVLRIEKREISIDKLLRCLEESSRTAEEISTSHSTEGRGIDEQQSNNVLEKDYKKIAEVCTNLWRLRKGIDANDGGNAASMRRMERYLDSVWQNLMELGYVIVDHTGEPYREGMVLSVLTYEPTPGITTEKVIETIKPSIFYRDLQIQIGEVIVGVPE